MQQIHRDRLKAMVSYLKRGDFNGIGRFNFQSYIENLCLEGDHICGTSACAIGFLPLVFPDQFKYTYSNSFMIRVCDGAAIRWNDPEIYEFLGITGLEFVDLFTPFIRVPQETKFGAFTLPATSSAARVAGNIEIFLKWKDSSKEMKYECKRIPFFQEPIEKIKALWKWFAKVVEESW